jgi:EthD domain
MKRLFDHQMANLADFDCFSQVVFKDVDDYKRMKSDPWYKQHLIGDHENFADTKRSMMTIGWITEFIRDGQVVDGMKNYDYGSGKQWNAVGMLVAGAAILLPFTLWLRFNRG